MRSTVARLTCDELAVRRLAAALADNVDSVVCSAFEAGPGQWQLAIHFADAADGVRVRGIVARELGEEATGVLAFEDVPEADWVAQSLAGLKPVRAGRFVVHGAHDRARIPENAIGIEIEAALAFGTGHHDTTYGCLMALDRLAKQRRARRVLDVGTGTGVLAIAAAKAFRRPVTASDIDRVAVTAARGNARLNRVASLITIVRATGTKNPAVAGRAPYDLIFANILLAPLTRLAVPLSRLLRRGGTIVLSGLLPAHANAALAVYRAQGLALARRGGLDGWVTLTLQKRSRPGRG